MNFTDLLTNYLPASIGGKLIRLHPEPKAFWFGQFTKFILRENKLIESLVKNVTKKQLTKHYVG